MCGDVAEAGDFAVKDTVTSLASAESVTDDAVHPSHIAKVPPPPTSVKMTDWT